MYMLSNGRYNMSITWELGAASKVVSRHTASMLASKLIQLSDLYPYLQLLSRHMQGQVILSIMQTACLPMFTKGYITARRPSCVGPFWCLSRAISMVNNKIHGQCRRKSLAQVRTSIKNQNSVAMEKSQGIKRILFVLKCLR